MKREKDPLARKRIVDDIRAERYRQDEKWGARTIAQRPIERGLTVLTEEVGEVAQALLDCGSEGAGKMDRATIRAELVQVAAVTVAMLEALDDGAPLLLPDPTEGLECYRVRHDYRHVDEPAPPSLLVSEDGAAWYKPETYVENGGQWPRVQYVRVLTPLAGSPREPSAPQLAPLSITLQGTPAPAGMQLQTSDDGRTWHDVEGAVLDGPDAPRFVRYRSVTDPNVTLTIR